MPYADMHASSAYDISLFFTVFNCDGVSTTFIVGHVHRNRTGATAIASSKKKQG